VLALASLLAFPFLAAWWLVRRDATIDGRRHWWLVLVPGLLTVYLAVRWAFSQQAVVLARRRNWAGLDTSADTVRGDWWKTLGTLLTVGLLQAGPVVLATASALAHPLVEATVTALVSALVLPFFVAAQTLLWYDLRSRKALDASPA
jgi:hypothetical protein